MMATCTSGKRGYETRELAVEGLIAAQVRTHGERGPVGVYQCDDCGLFPLTSSGPVDPRLAAMQTDGSLRKLREASHWEEKFKRR